MHMPSEHIPVAQTVKYQTEDRRESFRAAAIVTQSKECGNKEERKGKDGGGERERQGRRVLEGAAVCRHDPLVGGNHGFNKMSQFCLEPWGSVKSQSQRPQQRAP